MRSFVVGIDDAIFRKQHFGGRVGFGASPALLIVDFTIGFADPDLFGGGNIRQAIRETVPLLAAARALSMPVAHSRIVYAEDGSDANVHTRKVPKLLQLTESNPASHFVPELEPVSGEIVVRKKLPSAFFATDLIGILNARSVDTLIVAGCTTSGCVRASALDAMCHGLRTIVVSDCVGDRAEGPHAASLFDLDKKYADVMSSVDVVSEIQRNKRAA
jgi:maleamate amidohydrolase